MAKASGSKSKFAQRYDKSRQLQLRLERRSKNNTLISNAFVLLIWCFLLLAPTNGYNNIPDVRMLWIIILTSLCIISILVNYLKSRVPIGIKAIIKGLSLADLAAITYIAALFIASVSSPYQDIVWFGAFGRREGFFVQLCYIITYFIVSRCYKSKPHHLTLLVCSMIFVAVVGILQHHFIDIFGLYQNDFNGAARFLTFIGNVNMVSILAGMMTVFLALLFIKTESKKQWLYFSGMAFMFYLQLCALSDSGWVNIAAGMMISIPFFATGRSSIIKYGYVLSSFGALGFVKEVLIKNLLTQSQIEVPAAIYATGLESKWLLLLLLGTIVAGAAFLFGKRIKLAQKTAFILACMLLFAVILGGMLGIELLGKNPDSGNIYQAREMLHGNMDNSFMNNRGYIWKSCFKLIKHTALIGSGPDTLSRLHKTVYGNEAKEILGVYVDKSHNEYLEYAISAGIPGLIAYLVLIIGTMVYWAKRAYVFRTENQNVVLPYIAAGCCVVAYAAQAVFNFSMPVCAPFFWVFLGMAASRNLKTSSVDKSKA